MAGDRRARRGILRWPGSERRAPHAVCGRRREAVDLLIPGRRPCLVLAHASEDRQGRPRRHLHLVRSRTAFIVPLGPRRAGGGGRRLPLARSARRSDRGAAADAPYRPPPEREGPGDRLAGDDPAGQAGDEQLDRPGRPPRSGQPRGATRQAHRRHDQGLARSRRAARRRQGHPPRRHSHPVAVARRADRRHQPRTEVQGESPSPAPTA